MSMKFFRRTLSVVSALFVVFTLSTTTFAQEITGGIRGNVTDDAGNAVSGATVTITHEPTGRSRTTSTDSDGNFSVSGLRVGGPYTVRFDSSEHRSRSYDNVQVALAERTALNTQLSGDAMEEVVVFGEAVEQTDASGLASTFNLEFIEGSVAFNRDLKDIIKRNPFANVLPGSESPLSIAGINPAYNNLTVDGVGQNDDFGLNDNGYPTQRSPISLEAVEALAVDISPFSPRYGGFSGGQINVVTKSGTNDFHGSLFFENIDSSRSGTPRDPETGQEVDLDFEEEAWGGVISGPIIRDKLFFLASYEWYETPLAIEWGPAGSNAPNQAQITQADLDAVIAAAESVYGVNPGDWNVSPVEEDEKILLKLDWNISDLHRAALTYQRTEGNQTQNTTSSPFELRLSSHWYNRAELMESYAVHFWSDWSDRFSTEIKLVDKSNKTTQAASDLTFGDVLIETASGDVALGPDQFRHANRLNNSTFQLVAHGNLFLGDHTLGFGVDYNDIDIFNLFANASLGVWEFSSIADFAARSASDFDYRNAASNNSNDVAASFGLATTALYLEDTWQLSDTLSLSVGARYERISASGAPAANSNFQNRYGFSNTENLDGADNFLPRLGFNWYATDTLRLKGGIGKYGGGRPNVWLSNSWSNDGVTFVQFNNQVAGLDPAVFLENVDITSIPQEVQNNLPAGDGPTNSIQPGFKVPTEWRYNIGAEYTFGNDWVTNLDIIFRDEDEALHWVDLARVDSGATTAPGLRPIYVPNDPNFTDRTDFMLVNAPGGQSTVMSISLSKSFDNGFSFYTSYANQDTEEGNPGTSSRAVSNYQFNGAFDRQVPTIGPASYEVEHRFTVDLRYAATWFSDYQTRFNLFFERRSGVPFSWTMGMFRDGDLGDPSETNSSSYYLPYIPSGPTDPNVVYSGTTYDEFWAQVEAAGLAGYAGGYVPKNVARTPWVSRMDLRVEQEIPGFSSEHRGVLYLEVLNLLDFLGFNGDVLDNQFRTSQRTLVDFGGLDPATNAYIYTEPFRGYNTGRFQNWDNFRAEESQWRMKLGLRYRF